MDLVSGSFEPEMSQLILVKRVKLFKKI